jgi:hypothetical protein
MSRLAASVTCPILFLVPSTLQIIQGLGSINVGILKNSMTSGVTKFSVAPLSISVLTLEWRVLEWSLIFV